MADDLSLMFGFWRSAAPLTAVVWNRS